MPFANSAAETSGSAWVWGTEPLGCHPSARCCASSPTATLEMRVTALASSPTGNGIICNARGHLDQCEDRAHDNEDVEEKPKRAQTIKHDTRSRSFRCSSGSAHLSPYHKLPILDRVSCARRLS